MIENDIEQIIAAPATSLGGLRFFHATGIERGRAEVISETAVRSKNDLDVKETVNLWAGSSAAVKSMLGSAGMNARKLGIICALLAAMPNLVGCESLRSQDYQFEKQVKR